MSRVLPSLSNWFAGDTKARPSDRGDPMKRFTVPPRRPRAPRPYSRPVDADHVDALLARSLPLWVRLHIEELTKARDTGAAPWHAEGLEAAFVQIGHLRETPRVQWPEIQEVLTLNLPPLDRYDERTQLTAWLANRYGPDLAFMYENRLAHARAFIIAHSTELHALGLLGASEDTVSDALLDAIGTTPYAPGPDGIGELPLDAVLSTARRLDREGAIGPACDLPVLRVQATARLSDGFPSTPLGHLTASSLYHDACTEILPQEPPPVLGNDAPVRTRLVDWAALVWGPADGIAHAVRFAATSGFTATHEAQLRAEHLLHVGLPTPTSIDNVWREKLEYHALLHGLCTVPLTVSVNGEALRFRPPTFESVMDRARAYIAIHRW